jgi:hypothetical protein
MKQGSGAVVVGAKVTVTNPKTSLNRAKNTNAAGMYTLPNLLPGLYKRQVPRSCALPPAAPGDTRRFDE